MFIFSTIDTSVKFSTRGNGNAIHAYMQICASSQPAFALLLVAPAASLMGLISRKIETTVQSVIIS